VRWGFAGAEPVDVGRAGPALLGRAERESRAARKQREEETERGRTADLAR